MEGVGRWRTEREREREGGREGGSKGESKWERGERVVVAHRPSCSAACGIFPDQGSNPCPLS